VKKLHFDQFDCALFLGCAVHSLLKPASDVGWKIALAWAGCAAFVQWVVDPIVKRITFTLDSQVEGFEGQCLPVWLNRNQIDIRFGGGVTGFFKRTKRVFGVPKRVGEEFHGIIKDGKVYSTALKADDDKPPAWHEEQQGL
jgi:hypothetical protein